MAVHQHDAAYWLTEGKSCCQDLEALSGSVKGSVLIEIDHDNTNRHRQDHSHHTGHLIADKQ